MNELSVSDDPRFRDDVEKTEPKPPCVAPGVTILLVDDHEVVRECISTILSSEGYRVIAASSAEAALARSRECLTSIELAIVSDLRVTGMSVVEFADLITRERPLIHVLIVSAGHLDHRELRPEYFFWQKPIYHLAIFREFIAAILG